MKKTTLNKLKKNKCYCLKKQEDILLSDCTAFQCNRWKKCMTKTNNDINKESRRGKSAKKVQKG